MNFLTQEFLSNPNRKQPGKTVIAHISDLHFEAKMGREIRSNLKWLKQDIKKHRPDIVVVTGDIIENNPKLKIGGGRKEELFSSYQNATDFFDSLFNKCGLVKKYSLFIVPGNHDYRKLGLKTNKTDPKIFQEKLGNYIINRPIPSLGILICCFDSNVKNDLTINWATGWVEEEKIQSFFSDEFDYWRSKFKKKKGFNNVKRTFDSLIKIAILHHHPMPIAEVETREPTKREEWLLLKNAGIFMKEMSRNDIDIILHGHRHFPGYSRAAYLIEQNKYRDIGVISAGSAGKKDPYYSYNIITIDDYGKIIVDIRKRHTAEYDTLSGAFPILDDEAVRKNRRRQILNSLKNETSIDKLLYSLKISDSGDADFNVLHKEWRSNADNGTKRLKGLLTFSKVGQPQDIKFESKTEGRTVVLESAKQTKDKITMDVVFEPKLEKKGMDVRLHGSIVNSFFFDERDQKALGVNKGKNQKEYVHARMRYNVDNLSIVITQPEHFKPKSVELEVFSDLEATDKDERETEFCRKFLTHTEYNNVISLMVPDPMPGYCYQVGWSLPSYEFEFDSLEPSIQGWATEIRKRLITISTKKREAIQSALKNFRNNITNSNHYKYLDGDANFEINLMGFDEKKRNLKLVAASPCEIGDYDSCYKARDKNLFIGEEIPGQALRRKEPVLFSEFIKKTKSYSKQKKAPTCKNSETRKIKLIYSIPLFFPFEAEGYGARMGVLSFVTCSNICSLHKILEKKYSLMSIYDEATTFFYDEIIPNLGLKTFPKV